MAWPEGMEMDEHDLLNAVTVRIGSPAIDALEAIIKDRDEWREAAKDGLVSIRRLTEEIGRLRGVLKSEGYADSVGG